ncbi:response regulator [Actinoplanes sp. NPDC049596]|uniref:response regulator n=1 Tax=unclassified Actinoplanes TaxID=2626549 RepID=UPI0034412AC8
MSTPPWSSKPVVLVVDDEPDIRETMTLMLQSRGFDVVTAAGPDEAMTICQQRDGRIDALVADLSLPGDLNGDLARRVTAAYPHVKVLFATGVPRNIALATGLVDPAAPYLQKPVDAHTLAASLHGLLTARPGPSGRS